MPRRRRAGRGQLHQGLGAIALAQALITRRHGPSSRSRRRCTADRRRAGQAKAGISLATSRRPAQTRASRACFEEARSLVAKYPEPYSIGITHRAHPDFPGRRGAAASSGDGPSSGASSRASGPGRPRRPNSRTGLGPRAASLQEARDCSGSGRDEDEGGGPPFLRPRGPVGRRPATLSMLWPLGKRL